MGVIFVIHMTRTGEVQVALKIIYTPTWILNRLLTFFKNWKPNSSGKGGEGTVAKDAIGNDIIASEWLKTHGPGDRTLTQGLKVNLIKHFLYKVDSSYTCTIVELLL